MSNSTLSQAQMAQFQTRGFLIIPAVFTPSEISEMAYAADRMLELAINSALATGERNPRCDLSATPDGRIDFKKLQPVNDLSDTIRAASEDVRLVGPLCELMAGQSPILMEEKLNYKQKVTCPEYVQQFSPRIAADGWTLHHDWGYYRAQGYPPETLSSAVTIDATTPENGPIRVIPGTHLQDYALKRPDPAIGDGQVVDGLFDPDDRVDVVAPAGSVMFFHSKLLHDSKPNSTELPRRLMIYSHYPGNFSFDEDARNRHGREAGRRVEADYYEKVALGEYTDLFSLSPK